MNANTPYLEVWIPDSLLFRDPEKTGFTYGYMFGVKSQINQPLRFHVQLETGAVFWSVPIHWLHSKPVHSYPIDLQDLQVWDCQSNSIETSIFTFLKDKKVDVRTPTNSWWKGHYRFSVDSGEGNYDNLTLGFSDHPDEKVYHIIDLDIGRFAAMPNNHLRWHNSDFIKPYSQTNPPKYKAIKELYSCESPGTAEDEYFYNFKS